MTALLDVEPFQGVDPVELDRLEAAGRIVEPRDGSKVFSEGDEADAFYLVRVGFTFRGFLQIDDAAVPAGELYADVT